MLVVAALSVLFIGGPHAFAQLSEDDARVLAGLNDDDYRVRQSATRELLADDALTQDDLDRLFLASQTPEQRHRLLGVSKHHVIRKMIRDSYKDKAGKGSMGISHQVVRVSELGEAAMTGVLVVQTLAGFPAYAALEPGDVMIAFAGQPLPENLIDRKLPELIQQYKAHDTINLTILREGEPMGLLFELEHSEALQKAYDTSGTGVKLKPPYQERWLAARARMLALLAPPPQETPGEDQAPETKTPDPSE